MLSLKAPPTRASALTEATAAEILITRLKARHDAELRNMIQRHARDLQAWRNDIASCVDAEYMTRVGKVPALPGVSMPKVNPVPLEIEMYRKVTTSHKMVVSNLGDYSSSEEDGEIKSKALPIPTPQSKGSVLSVMELQGLLMWQYRIIRMHQHSEYQDLRSEQLHTLIHCWRKRRDEQKEAQDNKVFKEAWERTQRVGTGPRSAPRPLSRSAHPGPSQTRSMHYEDGPYRNKTWHRPATSQSNYAWPRQQSHSQAVPPHEDEPPVVTHKLTENEYAHLKKLREAVLDSPWLTKPVKDALMDQWKKAHGGHLQLADFVAELRKELREAQTMAQAQGREQQNVESVPRTTDPRKRSNAA